MINSTPDAAAAAMRSTVSLPPAMLVFDWIKGIRIVSTGYFSALDSNGIGTPGFPTRKFALGKFSLIHVLWFSSTRIGTAEIANRELGRSWRKEVLAERILRFRFDEKYCEFSGKLCK